MYAWRCASLIVEMIFTSFGLHFKWLFFLLLLSLLFSFSFCSTHKNIIHVVYLSNISLFSFSHTKHLIRSGFVKHITTTWHVFITWSRKFNYEIECVYNTQQHSSKEKERVWSKSTASLKLHSCIVDSIMFPSLFLIWTLFFGINLHFSTFIHISRNLSCIYDVTRILLIQTFYIFPSIVVMQLP